MWGIFIRDIHFMRDTVWFRDAVWDQQGFTFGAYTEMLHWWKKRMIPKIYEFSMTTFADTKDDILKNTAASTTLGLHWLDVSQNI